MSLQDNSKNAEASSSIEDDIKKISNFEKHIINCCKNTEWDLRKWLHKVLTRAGFVITEDNYRTERCDHNKKYETIHNMFAVRGKPNVCLVAHTDVCREHEETRGFKRKNSEYQNWMNKAFDDDEQEDDKIIIDPVVKKVVDADGNIRRIIQDRHCKTQTGGDDRLGVAINTWIALNSGYDLALYFPTDEEIGLKSAAACEMKELKDFDLFVQVDRGNHTDELVTKIGGNFLCSWETATRLLEIAYDMGMPRAPVSGLGTDVAALIAKGKIKEAVNMTCGYHESHGASSDEFIEVEEAKNTFKYVSNIVKNYYLNP